MYLPKHFEESNPQALRDFMRAHPLAMVVVNDGCGLSADHMPLRLEPAGAAQGVLQGHVARANPLWSTVGMGLDCLAVFHGAQHYISPNWYATKAQTGKVVPTWNYEVVHVNGRIRAIDDSAWLRALLVKLTAEHEHGQPRPWRIDDAPQDYIDRLLLAIVGVEIEILGIVGKAKLSQNQPQENKASVIDALRAVGDAAAAGMADAVQRRRDGGG